MPHSAQSWQRRGDYLAGAEPSPPRRAGVAFAGGGWHPLEPCPVHDGRSSPAAIEGAVNEAVLSLLGASPPLILASVGSLLLYLAGLALSQLRKVSYALLLITGAIVCSAVVLIMTTLLATAIASAWPVVLIGVLGLLLLAARNRDRGTGLGVAVRVWLDDATSSMATAIERVAESLSDAWNPHRAEARYIFERELRESCRRHADLLPGLVSELEPARVAVAAQSLRLTYDDIPPSKRVLYGVTNSTALGRDLRRGGFDAVQVRVVREALVQKLERDDYALLPTFVAREYDATTLRRQVRENVRQAVLLLRTSVPELYNEYDRIRAEAAFREGVALPLAVLLAAGAYQLGLHRVLTGEAVGFAYMCAAALFAVMYIAGREKDAEASELLYGALRQGVVDAGSQPFSAREVLAMRFRGRLFYAPPTRRSDDIPRGRAETSAAATNGSSSRSWPVRAAVAAAVVSRLRK